ADDVYGRSRPGQHESVHRPAGGYRMHQVARSDGRQIVGHSGGKCMTDVEVRIAAVDIRTRYRTWRIEIVRERVGRGRIDGVRERIRCDPLQASRHPALKLELKSVVIGSR